MSPTISTDSSRAGAAAMAMESIWSYLRGKKAGEGIKGQADSYGAAAGTAASNFNHVVDVNRVGCFKIPLASLPAI